MNNIKYIFIIYFLNSANVLAENNKHNFVPKEGYVPDAQTAIKIAEAIWLPIYGDKIYKKKPFTAQLKDNIWVVQGSMPTLMLGGVPVAEISKLTGQILRVSHGQ